MTDREKEIDKIDLELFRLRERALSLGLDELYEAIREARMISWRLLPEGRRKQV